MVICDFWQHLRLWFLLSKTENVRGQSPNRNCGGHCLAMYGWVWYSMPSTVPIFVVTAFSSVPSTGLTSNCDSTGAAAATVRTKRVARARKVLLSLVLVMIMPWAERSVALIFLAAAHIDVFMLSSILLLLVVCCDLLCSLFCCAFNFYYS